MSENGSSDGFTWGTGRRKTSVARVRLKKNTGNGDIRVNGSELETYFPTAQHQVSVQKPFKETDTLGDYTVRINASGGGKTGQAEAALLGIARALIKADSELEETLRDQDFLTRDPRMKERNKYGKHGARRGKQYSKR